MKNFFLLGPVLIMASINAHAEKFTSVLCAAVEGAKNISYICTDDASGAYHRMIFKKRNGEGCFLSMSLGKLQENEYSDGYFSKGHLSARDHQFVNLTVFYGSHGYEQAYFVGLQIEGVSMPSGYRRYNLDGQEITACDTLQDAGL